MTLQESSIDVLPMAMSKLAACVPCSKSASREVGALLKVSKRTFRWIRFLLTEKPYRQSLRFMGLRLWPVSVLMRHRYDRRFADSNFVRITADSREHHRNWQGELSGESARVGEELRLSGVSVTTVSRCLGDTGEALLQSLKEMAKLIVDDPGVRVRLERLKDIPDLKRNLIRWRGLEVHGTKIPAPLCELFLSKQVLSIVNGYLGLSSRLHYVDLWYSMPVIGNRPGYGSELWHRDYEDRNFVKVFMYVDAVDETMGPFSFIKGSQRGGNRESLVDSQLERPPLPTRNDAHDEALGDAVSFPGEVGTLVFADTSGHHKGGRTFIQPRILLTAWYGSDAALNGTRYVVDGNYYDQIPEEARWALGSSQARREGD